MASVDDPNAPATVPWVVRLAGLGAVVEGVAAVVVAVVLVIAAAPFAVWGFFVLLGVGVAGAGGALVVGQRGARGPVIVVQLIALGCAFYAAVPSARPEWGIPAALVVAAVLVGLLCAPARAWAGR